MQLNDAIAENIKKSTDWQEFSEYVNAVCDTLKNIDDIDWTDKEKAAIQGQGKEYAYQVLQKILEPFLIDEQSSINRKKDTASKTGMV